ncbi:hypothetical protein A8F43_27515 [Burkholderia cenocepacia]|nr:hypothetical protein A8F43_27515 [Burkholderia cenocepacia]
MISTRASECALCGGGRYPAERGGRDGRQSGAESTGRQISLIARRRSNEVRSRSRKPSRKIGHQAWCSVTGPFDLPPANRASRSLVKFVFGEEDEHEEALYGTANHRVSEGSRGRYAGQGTVQEARVQ